MGLKPDRLYSPFPSKVQVFSLLLCAASFGFVIIFQGIRPPSRLRLPHREHNSNVAKRRSNANNPITALRSQRDDDSSIVILLQQSPVDQRNQLSRLKTIDSGWATWRTIPTRFAVYAAIPTQLNKENAANAGILMKRIKPIFLKPVGKGELRPDQNMIKAFVHIIANEDNMKWFVFTNDHSFILPPNLAHFLNSLDSDVPVYSGNVLYRGPHRNFKLYFASGGAGAVLSHVSLKLLLLSWAVSRNKDLVHTLSDIKADLICAGDRFVTTEYKKFACELLSVVSFVNQNRNSTTISDELELNVRVSPKIVFKLLKDGTSKLLHIGYKEDAILSLSSGDLSRCNFESAWEKINPGLVVAYCIESVFQTNITRSEASDGERFNVYGLLRTIKGDVDNWYAECKLEAPPGSLSDAMGKGRLYPVKIARDVISFHYVSEKESDLLFKLLTHQVIPEIELSKINAEDLLKWWPSTSKEFGHYSRKLSGIKEAEIVLKFISEIMIIY